MKILLVDNDINTVETLRAVLFSRGNHTVDVAYSGAESLAKMRAGEPYDLLLLDIMMPEISGIDVCQEMVKDEKLKKIPVVLISALPISSKDFRESLEKFNELNVVKGVLEKPFSIEDLLNKVSEVSAPK